jgi:hypothetical protein
MRLTPPVGMTQRAKTAKAVLAIFSENQILKEA